jgi:hypothetical protein
MIIFKSRCLRVAASRSPHKFPSKRSNLTTYGDVRSRAKLIAEVTRTGYMPPWHAASGGVKFRGERRLAPREVEILQAWARDGATEGDANKLPPLPDFAEGWVLGEPDLVLAMPKPFVIPEDGPDIYRSFAIPTQFEDDRWIRAIEFRAGVRAVVHHSFFFLDPTGTARDKKEADSQPGFREMGARSGRTHWVDGISAATR